MNDISVGTFPLWINLILGLLTFGFGLWIIKKIFNIDKGISQIAKKLDKPEE